MLGQTVPSARAAATEKARSPTVDSRVRWTFSDSKEEDRGRFRVQKSAVYPSSSARYGKIKILHPDLVSSSVRSTRTTLA